MISVKNLSFKYTYRTIIKNMSFNFEEGKITGILGPNGAGKTTIIKILGGVAKPYTGTIKIYNKELRKFKRRELSKIVAVVPQNFELGFDFKVKEFVMMGRTPYLKLLEPLNGVDFRAVEEALKLTGTKALQENYMREISGGERQRVIIAMALAQTPKVLLLDEPTANLDLKHQIMVFELLRNLIKRKLIVIVAMHDINLAMRFCDVLILINNGKILDSGMPSKVITEKNIKIAYGINAKIIKDAQTDMSYVIPK